MTLLHLISSRSIDAVVRYSLSLCQHFQNQGWKVVVVCRGVNSIDALFRSAGIETLYAPLHGTIDFPSVIRLTRYFKSLPADEPVVIHTHRYKDAFTALSARKLANRDIKIISTRHKSKPAINTRLYRRIYRNIDVQIFVSRLAKRRFLSRWAPFPPPMPLKRMIVLHTSLKSDGLQNIPTPEHGAITALFHGTLREGQGLETLIDAMSLLKNHKIRLRISGTGNPDYVDSLRHRAVIRQVMNRIDWKKGKTDYQEDLKQTHFGVAPANVEWAAGHDNILFLASGRAHIATACGAPAEFLTHNQDAILIAPNDPSALAEAMINLADNTDLRGHLERKALELYNKRLSWTKHVAAINKIYNSKD